MAKVTDAQRAHLEAIAAEEGRGSYPRLKMNVLEALERKGLVKSDRTNHGSFYTPQTAIRWFTTVAGRRALEQGGK